MTFEEFSAAGRMYARSGGVSQAVKECVQSIRSDYPLKAVCASGIPDCKHMLQDILNGCAEGNFFEGMACPGGCVGGPKANREKEAAAEWVDRYADQAVYRTPAENPYVLDLIQRLGFHTIREFIENSQILERNF